MVSKHETHRIFYSWNSLMMCVFVFVCVLADILLEKLDKLVKM